MSSRSNVETQTPTEADRAERVSAGRRALWMPLLLPVSVTVVFLLAEVMNLMLGVDESEAPPGGWAWVAAVVGLVLVLSPQIAGLVWARSAWRGGARRLGGLGLALNGLVVVGLAGFTVVQLLSA